MPTGKYKIIAIRYHESLPKDVLPLILGTPWGYKFENNTGKMCLSEDCEQSAKNLVIAQIRAEPERTHVSLELYLEDLEYTDLRKEIAQSKHKFTKDFIDEHCCSG